MQPSAPTPSRQALFPFTVFAAPVLRSINFLPRLERIFAAPLFLRGHERKCSVPQGGAKVLLTQKALSSLHAGETLAIRFFLTSCAYACRATSYLQVSHGRDASATMASWHGRPGHVKLDRSVNLVSTKKAEGRRFGNRASWNGVPMRRDLQR